MIILEQKSATCGLIFAYLCLGVIAICVICWSMVCIIPFRELYGNGFTLPQIIFCLLSVAASALGSMAIVGYFKRSHKLTLSFAVVVILVSILFVIIGVMVILELIKIKPVIEGRMFKLYMAYNDSSDSDMFDSMQYNLGCCGYHNYTDWYYNTSTLPIPPHLYNLLPLSCCQSTSDGDLRHELCIGAGVGLDYLRTKGCKTQGFIHALKGILPLAITAFIIAIIGIACSTLSFRESNRMRHEGDDDDEDKSGSEDEDADDEADDDEEAEDEGDEDEDDED